MLTIIIVNWNVRDLLRACLRSLERYPASRHQQRIIVVDNASTDGSVAMLRDEFPTVHVVASARNVGYGGGNNLGLAHAEHLDSSADSTAYYLILNPDTEAMPGALDALLDYADGHPNVGVVGPQLRHADGTVQSSRRRFPTLATALFESTWLQPLASRRLLDDYYVCDRRDDETCDVDWLVGAALLTRREVYRQVGGFDAQTFFMYSEEIDWCRRIKQAGWRVVYHPQAVIVHHEGKSSEQVSAQRMIHFNTSKVRYFAKHHGALQAGVLRLALLSLFAEQSLVEGVKWLIGHRRPLRAERLAAYRAVLRSGLR
ncbi:MAG: glycosyltransferase family 2 protein [Anaerolineae bacterium]